MASSLSPLLIIGAGYLLYRSGALNSLAGGLGQTMQTPAATTRTTPGQPSAGGSTTPAAGAKSCAMIPGIQYVAPKGGGFVVVVGGREVALLDDQASAEREYNRLLGC